MSQDFVVSTFDNATNGGTLLGDMPKCIPPPKGKTMEEDVFSISVVARAVNIVLNLSEHMLPTPYKKTVGKRKNAGPTA